MRIAPAAVNHERSRLCRLLSVRAEKERLLRERIRLHAEHVRERGSRQTGNPADDMRSAQRELEIVSVLAAAELSGAQPRFHSWGGVHFLGLGGWYTQFRALPCSGGS